MTKSTRVLIRAKGRGLCIERGLHDCFQRELFADITFNCDEGEKIRANKGVLAAASPVLCTLLKDWPLMEDACIIMAGYSKEEVQGLVRYIYTGQLSAPKVQGSSWEKIIEDFRVGTPLEHEDDLASIHELEDYGEVPPSRNEAESNGAIERQPSISINPTSKYVASRALGPKIVAVTSPRPLIVQVQSLTQAQSSTSQNFEGAHDGMTIPNEMTVENNGSSDMVPSSSSKKHHGGKRKRALAAVAPVQFQVKKQHLEAAPATGNSRLTLPPLRLSIKKTAIGVGKRAKPAMSKFSRKKYVCPHCSRRFLTRGNIKNHLRTHNKDKPFQCTICQDLFAYQGVFQRHLIKHLEKKEISEAEMEPIIAESRRLAGELAKEEQDSVQVLDDDDDTEEPQADVSGELDHKEVKEETVEEDEEDEEEELELEGESVEVDENGDLDEEEAHIALKLKSTAVAGSSQSGMGTHFLCMDSKAEGSGQDEEDPGGTGKPTRKRAAISARGKVSPAVVFPSDSEVTSRKSEPPSLQRMNDQLIKCDFCPMNFQKWSAFYIHRCSHTGEDPVFPCGICDQEFPDIKALKEHKIAEHRESMFQCESCDRVFLSKSALQMHQPVHSTEFNFQCRHCPEKMKTLKERHIHERSHSADVSLKCSHCDKQFTTMASFRSHIKTHGKEEEDAEVHSE